MTEQKKMPMNKPMKETRLRDKIARVLKLSWVRREEPINEHRRDKDDIEEKTRWTRLL